MRCYRYIKIIIVLIAVISSLAWQAVHTQRTATATRGTFIASIDTMKVSRDTVRHPLSLPEINHIIKLSASLNANYITVDTQWDYPNYMAQWINAIRLAGHHVWFRGYPRQWEDGSGNAGIMTPAQYMAYEQNFIQTHPLFFQAGDILDPCPEPEQGLYWKATYGENWTNNAPNAATAAYNAFLRRTTDIANIALYQNGVLGVITTIRSINSFFATHRSVLEQATVDKFGYLTIDSYPEQDTQLPSVAAQARVAELNKIEALWHVPIVLGEMGYSNLVPVDDSVQHVVLHEELLRLQSLPYLTGVNYWVGTGSDTAGGYTYIFTQRNNAWVLRPAAHDLAAFYLVMQKKR